MKWLKFLLLALIISVWAAIACIVLEVPRHGFRAPEPKPEPRVDPILQARFDRIQVGMTLTEAEAILGDAGPSYSSHTDYRYHIWKSKEGWISVIVRRGKITSSHIQPGVDPKNEMIE
jgi:hypothetical protein